MEKVVLVQWALLAEWWCAEKTVSEKEIVDIIHAHTQVSATPEQVGQRLFGGFQCADDENRVHIYHASGHYTYLGENWDMTPEERASMWSQLVDGNKGQKFLDGPFTSDRPEVINA